MAVKRIARLQPQAVARAQAGQLQSVGRAGGEQRFGQLHRFGCGMVKLESVLARVARTADEAVIPHRAFAKVIN